MLRSLVLLVFKFGADFRSDCREKEFNPSRSSQSVSRLGERPAAVDLCSVCWELGVGSWVVLVALSVMSSGVADGDVKEAEAEARAEL